MNDSTAVSELWERIEPDPLRAIVGVFAAHGEGVRVELVPDREEDNK
jgi:hypothetical protein